MTDLEPLVLEDLLDRDIVLLVRALDRAGLGRPHELGLEDNAEAAVADDSAPGVADAQNVENTEGMGQFGCSPQRVRAPVIART